jgi:ORF6N domain
MQTTLKTSHSSDFLLEKIALLRGHKVLMSNDLADLYQVEHKVMMQAVTRNMTRFPEDFMFQLSVDEWQNLKSQIVTSSWGGVRKQPYAFTEQGVAMLSSVLRSPQAIQVNIEIMRTFIQMRQVLSQHHELAQRMNALEKNYDVKFKAIFDALRQLMQATSSPSRPIGFTAEIKK